MLPPGTAREVYHGGVSERGELTGRHKAVWLMAFGFVPKRWAELEGALRRHAAAHDVTAVERSPFGSRYVVGGHW
jgi:hypothetical protein